MDRAKTLWMTLDYALEEYPPLTGENPLKGWDKSFNKSRKGSGIKSLLSPQQVKELFKAAAKHPEWIHNIPYMALLHFTGSRPFDVGDTKNAARRWNWGWFDEWKHQSGISGGYIATLPAWNKDGTKASSKIT